MVLLMKFITGCGTVSTSKVRGPVNMDEPIRNAVISE
jgi:hypothetical protein